MLDNLLDLVGLFAAVATLVVIAFPEIFHFGETEKVKRVGSSYWGVYQGTEPTEPEEMKTIEIKPATRREKVVAGSQMYAMGRGTSFRM